MDRSGGRQPLPHSPAGGGPRVTMRLNPAGILALGLCALFVGLLAWSLLSAIAGWLLVACLTLALWRLWRAAYGPPDSVPSVAPPAPPRAESAKMAASRRLEQAMA